MSRFKGSHHRASTGLAIVAVLLTGLPSVVLADRESEVVALESRCETERQERIAPLRDMEIAKCKADSHDDPEYCSRFWRDYGNAMRAANGTTVPRMFDDLPVCVEAFKARKALANGDAP